MAVELDQRHASTHQVRLDDDPAMVSGTVTTTDRLGCVLDEDKLAPASRREARGEKRHERRI